MEIEALPAAAADDTGTVSTLTDLVNAVYAVAEDGLWIDGTTRTTVEELAGLIRAGEIVVARSGGQTLGCVRVQRLDSDVYEFGMLAADPAHRGVGVGRELVRFAEQAGRDADCSVMQLELLVPQDWTHPSKQFLAGWYGRIGYKVVGTGEIEESYPHLAPLLATPCDYKIFHKDLTT
ncbi:GNAT family N-acetyltransferase [Pseudonocardia xinjiangensis]|uniref:GNAT family N-acetyltransferase n=1 Tax=Pseudonocardia xinjiangensis TaxID=75289 RepID=A0ABX1R873_9PSEU|nr:GNAT family N-acetyltransferase [Pseudonocardia xinjiangensis]